MRRTSHIDMIPVGQTMVDGLLLEGRSRDVLSDGIGRAVVVGEATVQASVGADRRLRELTTTPHEATLAQLLGRPLSSGFRAQVDAAVVKHRSGRTPLYLLLDELPVAALISGYADLYHRPDQETDPPQQEAAPRGLADICAGWASDATMMQAISAEGRIPVPVGPEAPRLDASGDAFAWHEMGPLASGAMRRRRRIDVVEGAPLRIDAMFRDTHVDRDGIETVLHEYALDATVASGPLTVLSCEAQAKVLPWPECPSAAASAGRLVGRSVDELRRFVRQQLVGTSTCTHLNDLLRSLADVAPLARQLRADAASRR